METKRGYGGLFKTWKRRKRRVGDESQSRAVVHHEVAIMPGFLRWSLRLAASIKMQAIIVISYTRRFGALMTSSRRERFIGALKPTTLPSLQHIHRVVISIAKHI